MGSPYRPYRRERGIMLDSIGDELLVYDEESGRAHSLNQTAAAVWHACDGQRELIEIAAECGIDQPTLELALDGLRKVRLLEEPVVVHQRDRVSRRVILKRSLAAGAGLGVALPVIRSIVAPSAAMAGSSSRNSRNNSLCTGAPSCSPGSMCYFSGNGNGVCLRSDGAACYLGANNSDTSRCFESVNISGVADYLCPAGRTCSH